MASASPASDTFLNSEPKEKNENSMHRFPLRLFAFSSDLGLLSAFLKLPALAIIGWIIAFPYFAYSLIHQPDKQSRKEEALYQFTANGLFPLTEAKLGVMGGKKLAALSKNPNTLLPKLGQPAYKALGGLLALLVLTPTLGDRISHKIVARYQENMA